MSCTASVGPPQRVRLGPVGLGVVSRCVVARRPSTTPAPRPRAGAAPPASGATRCRGAHPGAARSEPTRCGRRRTLLPGFSGVSVGVQPAHRRDPLEAAADRHHGFDLGAARRGSCARGRGRAGHQVSRVMSAGRDAGIRTAADVTCSVAVAYGTRSLVPALRWLRDAGARRPAGRRDERIREYSEKRRRRMPRPKSFGRGLQAPERERSGPRRGRPASSPAAASSSSVKESTSAELVTAWPAASRMSGRTFQASTGRGPPGRFPTDHRDAQVERLAAVGDRHGHRRSRLQRHGPDGDNAPRAHRASTRGRELLVRARRGGLRPRRSRPCRLIEARHFQCASD